VVAYEEKEEPMVDISNLKDQNDHLGLKIDMLRGEMRSIETRKSCKDLEFVER